MKQDSIHSIRSNKIFVDIHLVEGGGGLLATRKGAENDLPKKSLETVDKKGNYGGVFVGYLR